VGVGWCCELIFCLCVGRGCVGDMVFVGKFVLKWIIILGW
jgi:lipid-A-disaccharide synthase-like uncharacterized protein